MIIITSINKKSYYYYLTLILNCVRNCLQDYDAKYCKPAINGYEYDDTLCTFNAHIYCFEACIEYVLGYETNLCF